MAAPSPQPEATTWAEVLPALTGLLRDGRFRPRAVVAAARGFVRFGRASVKPLVTLRRSFWRWTLVWAAVAVLALAFIAAHTSVAATLIIGVLQLAHAGFVLPLMWLQLALVRGPDGILYSTFGLPNGLTLMRLLLVPVTAGALALAPDAPALAATAFVLFAACAVTDLLDGLLARTLGRQSDLGRLADPAGDILFNPAAALGLAIAGVAPFAYAAILI